MRVNGFGLHKLIPHRDRRATTPIYPLFRPRSPKTAYAVLTRKFLGVLRRSRITQATVFTNLSSITQSRNTLDISLRRVALYPAELRVPVKRNYSSRIPSVNAALTRLKPARVADHLMAFTCQRLGHSFRRGGCNVVAAPHTANPRTRQQGGFYPMPHRAKLHCEKGGTSLAYFVSIAPPSAPTPPCRRR